MQKAEKILWSHSVTGVNILLMWFQDTFLRSKHFLCHMKGTVKHRKPCALKYFVKQFIESSERTVVSLASVTLHTKP